MKVTILYNTFEGYEEYPGANAEAAAPETKKKKSKKKNNPDGYRRSSPRFDAKDLHGRLLLIHGTSDDNVHPQNTFQFAHELQNLGKPFEMMLYPKTKHSVSDRKTQHHIALTTLDFLRRALR